MLNVLPDPIESVLETSEFVEQCLVVGSGEKLVSAIVVPNFEAIQDWAHKNDKSIPSSKSEMCDNKIVRNRIQRELNWVNLNFEDHEQIKEFYLIADEFTEENGLLTPSTKKKRPQIIEKYGHLWQTT